MQNKQKKKSSSSKLVIFIVVCFVSIILIKQQIEINTYNKKISELEAQIKTEEARSKEIDKKDELYATDEYIEKVARDELGLVKPDEKVFVDSGNNWFCT